MKRVLDFAMRRGGCLEVAHQLQKEGRVRFIGFSTHAVPRIDITSAIESGESITSTCTGISSTPLNWSSVAGGDGQHDNGRILISPNDKGGIVAEPARTRWRSCARRCRRCSSTTSIALRGPKCTH